MKEQTNELTEIELMALDMDRLFIEAEKRQTLPKKHPSIIKAEALYNAGYRKQSENTVEVVRCADCCFWKEESVENADTHIPVEELWGITLPIKSVGIGECICKKWKETKVVYFTDSYLRIETTKDDYCCFGKMKGGAE